MSVSRPCEQCDTVRRCRMFIDGTTGRPVYLCGACARELGYDRAPMQLGIPPCVIGQRRRGGHSMKLPVLTCQRCGHAWIPRQDKVWVCAKCHSPKWNEPMTKRQTKGVAR
jgi:ribosomal protein S27AE